MAKWKKPGPPADRLERPIESGALVRFEPKNRSQRRAQRAAEQADVVFLIGPAGGGKTACAVGLALAHAVPRGERVSVSRPAVEAGNSLGYLKGTMEEKYGPWVVPVIENAKKFLFDPSGYERHLDLSPLGYLRGKTFEGAAILDEAQNCTTADILLFLTRMGAGCKLFISGDPQQSDIDESGLMPWARALKGCPGVACVYFPEDECLRHPLVAEIIRRRPRE